MDFNVKLSVGLNYGNWIPEFVAMKMIGFMVKSLPSPRVVLLPLIKDIMIMGGTRALQIKKLAL